MTWGDPTGFARWSPAKLAYGGAHGFDEEQRAFEASVAAGVTLFDTAAMYSGGASEGRLEELARGKDVSIATKFPPSPFSRTESLPKALDASLARLGRSSVDLYQHHFPWRLPAAVTTDLAKEYALIGAGQSAFGVVTDTVPRLTGQAARSVDQFARDYAHALATPSQQSEDGRVP